MSEPTTTTTASAIAIKSLIRPFLTILTGGALGFGTAKFTDTHKDSSAPVAKAAPVATPQRQIQIVTLFDCQYLVFQEPFFILHLPKCTNHPAGK